MKSVLISIRPKWCELIANGKKTIEARKSAPKIEVPFKVYIYCTQYKFVDYINYGYGLNMAAGKIIGEFVCDKVHCYVADDFVGAEDLDGTIRTEPVNGDFAYWIPEEKDTCVPYGEILKYGNGKTLYGWHISDLKIYDKPKELGEFTVVDKKAIRQCEHRFQSYYSFTDTGHIKNGFGCDEKDDWCFGCKRKPLIRSPQSWCYVEELQND